MAEPTLKALPPVPVNIVKLGETFSAQLRTDVSLVNIACRNGKFYDLARTFQELYGVSLPREPRYVVGQTLAVAWVGQDQWLAIAPDPDSRDLEAELRGALQSSASIVDQTDGRSLVRISGTRARDVLAKGLPLDLHPSAFKPGHAAITHVSHIGALFWQVDATPTYDVAVFRSFTESFAHWIQHSAEEFAH